MGDEDAAAAAAATNGTVIATHRSSIVFTSIPNLKYDEIYS